MDRRQRPPDRPLPAGPAGQQSRHRAAGPPAAPVPPRIRRHGQGRIYHPPAQRVALYAGRRLPPAPAKNRQPPLSPGLGRAFCRRRGAPLGRRLRPAAGPRQQLEQRQPVPRQRNAAAGRLQQAGQRARTEHVVQPEPADILHLDHRALPAQRPGHRRHGLPLDIPPQPEPGIQHPALARPLPAELLHGHARPRPDPESGLHRYLQPAADSAGQPQPEAEHEPPREPAGTLTAERQCAPPDLEQPVQHPARPDGPERQLRAADGCVHLSARQHQRKLEHAAQPALPPQAGPQEPLQHGCQHPVRLLPQRRPENRRHDGRAAPQPRGPVPAHGGPDPAL